MGDCSGGGGCCGGGGDCDMTLLPTCYRIQSECSQSFPVGVRFERLCNSTVTGVCVYFSFLTFLASVKGDFGTHQYSSLESTSSFSSNWGFFFPFLKFLESSLPFSLKRHVLQCCGGWR